MSTSQGKQDREAGALLAGADGTAGVVAVECDTHADQACTITRFRRQGEKTLAEEVDFRPFLWVESESLLDGFDQLFELVQLEGGQPLRLLATFASWKAFQAASRHLRTVSGKTPGAPNAPYRLMADPVQQYLMQSGCTLFKDMTFADLHRLQLDIETYTEAGFEFCNPERDADRITAIALSDNRGWSHVLDGSELDEKTLLRQMVQFIRERDPDVIEGHNIFNFDLAYIMARAKKHRVKLALGRDGSPPRSRPSRFSIAERVVHYTRTDIHGRHVIDTYQLVQFYDITNRSLDSFGLKNVTRHFGIAAPERTYLDGSRLAAIFDEDPALLMRYALDDATETRALAALLSPVYFAQAQMLPFTYQNVAVRGNAMKIDALLLREYLRLGHAAPQPQPPQKFAGGYTDIFFEGVALGVHHCDVRSLYPSLMLQRAIGPASDPARAFLRLLGHLRELRLELKAAMQKAVSPDQRAYFDAQQGCLKILINSFYGYLGFAQGHFNDFNAAEQVTAQGRELLRHMIRTVEALGGRPIEIDTDGIYYMPPDEKQCAAADFRAAFISTLPPGIEVEFDGEYRAMFSYKMKNYALLEEDGTMIIKGAALKSRGIERFLRRYIREYLRLKLEQRDNEIPALQQRYRDGLRHREWDIALLAKTETLQGDPKKYAEKVRDQARGRNAAYELALASGCPYRAGDQISYYVTGNRKSVAVHASAKRVADWNPGKRDENIPYYLDKLESLFKKFGHEANHEQQLLF